MTRLLFLIVIALAVFSWTVQQPRLAVAGPIPESCTVVVDGKQEKSGSLEYVSPGSIVKVDCPVKINPGTAGEISTGMGFDVEIDFDGGEPFLLEVKYSDGQVSSSKDPKLSLTQPGVHRVTVVGRIQSTTRIVNEERIDKPRPVDLLKLEIDDGIQKTIEDPHVFTEAVSGDTVLAKEELRKLVEHIDEGFSNPVDAVSGVITSAKDELGAGRPKNAATVASAIGPIYDELVKMESLNQTAGGEISEIKEKVERDTEIGETSKQAIIDAHQEFSEGSPPDPLKLVMAIDEIYEENQQLHRQIRDLIGLRNSLFIVIGILVIVIVGMGAGLLFPERLERVKSGLGIGT